MDVRREPQNPCRVLIPQMRTAKSVAVMFHSLAMQLERHPGDAPVTQLRFVQKDRSIEVELERGEAEQATLFGDEGSAG